jgi:hypothetical protein
MTPAMGPIPRNGLRFTSRRRIDAVREYHRRNKLPVGQSASVHSIAHAVVESQIATGDVTAVPATLARLMREGLDRHDAVHAIGSVLMGMIFDMTKRTTHRDFDRDEYNRELAALTAASWRSQD